MLTECSPSDIEERAGAGGCGFRWRHGLLGRRRSPAGEDGQGIQLVDRFASCFRDQHHRAYVLHEVKTLVAQRVFGLALGYEDLVDHDELRRDLVRSVMIGKREGGGACTAGRQEPAESAGARPGRGPGFGD